MIVDDRPVLNIWSPKWRVLAVSLSADEHVALNKLARKERREKADVAALLIVMALEERGLLPKEFEEAPF